MPEQKRLLSWIVLSIKFSKNNVLRFYKLSRSQQKRSIKLNWFFNKSFAREIVLTFPDSINFESLNFKLPHIVLSCLSDRADKKRKRAYSTRNRSNENSKTGKCKMQVHQQFDADIVSPVSNFIKNKTAAQVLSCELCTFFQLVSLLKPRFYHKCFLVNFEKFFSLQLT